MLLNVVPPFLFASLQGVFVDLGVGPFAPFVTTIEFVGSVGAVFGLQAIANSTVGSTSFGSLTQSTSIRLYAEVGCVTQGDQIKSSIMRRTNSGPVKVM